MGKTALYRHYNVNGTLLYVGISSRHLVRLGSHAENADWRDMIATVKVEHFDSREEALVAEREAIQSEEPLFNLVHAPAGSRTGMLRRAFRQIDLDEIEEFVDEINDTQCSTYRNECLSALKGLAKHARVDFDKEIKTRIVARELPECDVNCPGCKDTE